MCARITAWVFLAGAFLGGCAEDRTAPAPERSESAASDVGPALEPLRPREPASESDASKEPACDPEWRMRIERPPRWRATWAAFGDEVVMGAHGELAVTAGDEWLTTASWDIAGLEPRPEDQRMRPEFDLARGSTNFMRLHVEGDLVFASGSYGAVVRLDGDGWVLELHPGAGFRQSYSQRFASCDGRLSVHGVGYGFMRESDGRWRDLEHSERVARRRACLPGPESRPHPSVPCGAYNAWSPSSLTRCRDGANVFWEHGARWIPIPEDMRPAEEQFLQGDLDHQYSRGLFLRLEDGVAHWDGTSWSRETLESHGPVQALFGDEAHVYAVDEEWIWVRDLCPLD